MSRKQVPSLHRGRLATGQLTSGAGLGLDVELARVFKAVQQPWRGYLRYPSLMHDKRRTPYTTSSSAHLGLSLHSLLLLPLLHVNGGEKESHCTASEHGASLKLLGCFDCYPSSPPSIVHVIALTEARVVRTVCLYCVVL